MEALIQYNTMRQALVKASAIDEVKDIRDRAEALRAYAKQAGESLENQNMCAEIKLRAERRAGELLGDMEKNEGAKGTGSNQYEVRSHDVTAPPKLADLGISRMQSSRWQSIATIPENVFEQHVSETKATRQELTSASVLRVVEDMKRAARKVDAQTVAQLPDKIYNVIYADPPWEYSNTGVHGAAEGHYPSMSIEQLEQFPVSINLKITDNAVLFMWITNPLIAEAFHLIEQWGFSYKTNMVWIKTELQKPGVGVYVRGRHEFLFVCTRGSFTPLDQHISPPIGSVVTAPIQEHSRKPEVFYEIIERLYPQCSYVELFARHKRAGWDSYGDQAA